MKTTEEKIRSYSANASTGKTSNRLSSLLGAIEVESASSLSCRTMEGFLRQENPTANIKVGTDSTIHTTADYDHDNEMRLRFESNDLATPLQVVADFAEKTQADYSSAVHVHINASSLIGRDLEKPASVTRLAQVLIPLASVCKRFENAFFGASGARQRKDSEWSQPWSDCAFDSLKRVARNPSLSALATAQSNRTSFLNLRNLQNSRYAPNERTIEFRCFSASSADVEEFIPTSPHHVEACLFLILNALSTALSETSKPLEKLRFELKHPTHEKSFQWFLHHCAKRPQIERWKDPQLVEQIIRYIWNESIEADNRLTY